MDKKSIVGLLIACFLSGCSLMQEMQNATTGPLMSEVTNPKEGMKKVQAPLPRARAQEYNKNSLWQPGAHSFFKDQRASRPGDILTVKININDNATMNNTTSRNRDSKLNTNISKLLGNETALSKAFPGMSVPNVLNLGSSPTHKGNGAIKRDEKIKLEVAAMVVQTLPNGCLVIKGEQEMMVNNEKRVLKIAGIVAKADIEPGNFVNSQRIAQARIYYGGQGYIQDAQLPKWGSNILEAILPF